MATAVSADQLPPVRRRQSCAVTDNPPAGRNVDPTLPSADFTADSEFRVVSNAPVEPYLVLDASQRTVACLPQSLGGEARTRTETWELETEGRELNWTVRARTIPGLVEVGRISGGWIPDTHKLWIAPDTNLRLTANPISGSMTLRLGRERLAHLTPKGLGQHSLGPRFIGPGFPAAIIKTFESLPDTSSFALAILLALEMIKIDSSIAMANWPSDL